jgi:hypothetical protein
MSMTIIVKQTSPYSRDYVDKKTSAHINPAFVTPMPMQRERYGRRVSPEQAERFQNRPGRVPWPWETRPQNKE